MSLVSPIESPLGSCPDGTSKNLPPPLLDGKENLEPMSVTLKQKRKVTFASPAKPRLSASSPGDCTVALVPESVAGSDEAVVAESGPDPWSELRDLDDIVKWSERSEVVTKSDHAAYIGYARDIVEKLVASLSCYEEEEFRPATELFSGNGVSDFELDFLDNVSSGASSDAALSRQSLYVRFDPLVQRATPDRALSSLVEAPTSTSSDLLQLDTPRPTSSVKCATAARMSAIASSSPFATPRAGSTSPPPSNGQPSTSPPIDDMPRAKLDFGEPASPHLPSTGPVNLLENTPLLERAAARCPHGSASEPSSASGETLEFTEADLQVRIDRAVSEAVEKARKQMGNESAIYDLEVDRLTAERDTLTAQAANYDKLLEEARQEADKCKASVAQSTEQSDSELADLITERNRLATTGNQLQQDLQSLENSFLDLFGRYEKLRHGVNSLQTASAEAKEKEKEARALLEEAALKNRRLKESAVERMTTVNSSMAQTRKDGTSDSAVLQANIKKAMLRVEGLQRSIQQKEDDNKKLTTICEEMMAQMQQQA